MRIVWLVLLGGCGRIGFDGADAGNATFGHVRSIQLGGLGAGTTYTFSIAAAAAGDAVVLQPACIAPSQPTLSVTASGWAFSVVLPPLSANGLYAAPVAAIAPDTNPVDVTVVWSVACSLRDVIGDEISGNDPTGGPTTFHADQATGSGNCHGSLMTADVGEIVWAACAVDGAAITAIAPGFTKGADDGHNDWTEFRQTSDPVGTPQSLDFTTSGGVYSMSSMSIRLR